MTETPSQRAWNRNKQFLFWYFLRLKDLILRLPEDGN
jgi:hypothetical protein